MRCRIHNVHSGIVHYKANFLEYLCMWLVFSQSISVRGSCNLSVSNVSNAEKIIHANMLVLLPLFGFMIQPCLSCWVVLHGLFCFYIFPMSVFIYICSSCLGLISIWYSVWKCDLFIYTPKPSLGNLNRICYKTWPLFLFSLRVLKKCQWLCVMLMPESLFYSPYIFLVSFFHYLFVIFWHLINICKFSHDDTWHRLN